MAGIKIAIYGDSFAHLIAPNLIINNDGTPWFQLVSDAVGGVANYAMSSSSFYYSYMNFKKNYINYDKHIFLGTFPGRRYIPIGVTENEIHAHIFHSRPEFKNHPDFGNKINQALTLYYGYLYNEEEDETYLKLMEKDILTHSNVLYLNLEKTLQLIYHRDKLYFDVDGQTEGQHENMHCHLTNESNKVLAEEVIQWLQTDKFNFDLHKYPLPNISSRGKYWLK